MIAQIIFLFKLKMGVLFSTWNYLASYTQWAPQKLEADKIKLASQKLSCTLRLKQIKLQNKTKSLEKDLINQINLPKSSEQLTQVRSLPIEQALMQEIVLNSEILAAYEQIIRCAYVIQNEAQILENNIGSISPDCQLAVFTIIYANKTLELEDIINLGQFVPKKMQSAITQKDVSQPLKEYVENTRKASHQALNFYALQMCYRNQISLDKLNEIGHNFKYNPSQWGHRQSKSSQMFAVQLEEIQMPIELEPWQQKNVNCMNQQKQFLDKKQEWDEKISKPNTFHPEYCWGDKAQQQMQYSKNLYTTQ